MAKLFDHDFEVEEVYDGECQVLATATTFDIAEVVYRHVCGKRPERHYRLRNRARVILDSEEK